MSLEHHRQAYMLCSFCWTASSPDLFLTSRTVPFKTSKQLYAATCWWTDGTPGGCCPAAAVQRRRLLEGLPQVDAAARFTPLLVRPLL